MNKQIEKMISKRGEKMIKSKVKADMNVPDMT